MTIEKLDMQTPNMTDTNVARIAELFPNVVTEGKDDSGKLMRVVDFDALKQELSGNIVEGPQERYRLDWPGKREAMLAANTPITKTLRPVREESVDFDTTKNLFIEGDNLDALKLLQETYLGKVKMIYIDPPYNTGKDFIYKDNFTGDKQEYLEESGQVDESGGKLVANPDSNGRYHSDWLSMMYPRLKLARNLLRDDGVVFVSIDENEVDALSKICSEIFGADNRIGHITVVSNLKGRSDDKYFATAHNYLLAISRGGFKSLGVELPEEYLSDYNETNNDGRRYRTQGLRKRGSSAKRVDRPNMYYPFYVNPSDFSVSLSKSEEHVFEVLPMLSTGEDGRWRWGKKTAAERIDLLKASTVGPDKRWDIFQIDYADSEDGLKRITPKSVWMGSEFANESGTLELKKLFDTPVFETPKPTGLIKYILEQSSHDATILDFFAGSASTAHAVIDNNLKNARTNKFILVQLPELTDSKSNANKQGYNTIAEISKERIRRAGKKILKENPEQVGKLDVGFRVLKIDDSNMNDVYYSPSALEQTSLLDTVEHIKPDRTAEDLLFQVMLDWGVDLSLLITCETFEGKTVYWVGENDLAACFDINLSENIVKAMAARKPLRAVFRDDGFATDDMKINAGQLFKQMTDGHTDMKVV